DRLRAFFRRKEERDGSGKGQDFPDHVHGKWEGSKWVGKAEQRPDREDQEHARQQKQAIARQLHDWRQHQQRKTCDLQQKEREKEKRGKQGGWSTRIGGPHDDEIAWSLEEQRRG